MMLQLDGESRRGALADPDDDTLRLNPKPVLELESGTKIGHYLILERIGKGGAGIVYQAYDTVLNREVAIKQVHRSTLGGSEGTHAVVAEAQAMARLSHPNIVAVYGVEQHDDSLLIAMEYIRGRTLLECIVDAQVTLTWEERLALLHQAGRGLEAAHREGLIHRDFKPSNVLVGDDGRVRVVDFGLARLNDDIAPDSKVGRGTALRSLVPRLRDEAMSTGGLLSRADEVALAGTPVYMSPECYRAGAMMG